MASKRRNRLAKSKHLQRQTADINTQLVISVTRQHEQTEAAEKLNEQLQVEIAERKRAEKELRAREQHLELLSNSIPALISYVDPDRRYRTCNDEFEKWFGLDGKEIIGLHVRDVVGEAAWEVIRPHLERAFAGEAVQYEIEAPYSRGGTRWIHAAYTPDRDAEGTVRGVVALVIDITERKRAELATALLAAIVESSDDAIISKDLNGVIISWNEGAKRLFGYTAQEAIGQPVTMLFPPDHLDEEPDILERVRRGESIEHYETVRRRKDGTLLDISLTVSPVKDAQGRVIGASKIAHDITEQKRAEKALREAKELLADRASQLERLVAERTAKLQELVGELEGFSYSIVHDLRAPLRALQGFSHMLEESYSGRLDDTARDYLRRITTSANRMDKLIQDTLAYSRVLRLDLRMERVDTEKLLRGMLETYPDFQEPKADVQIEGELPDVLANEAALTQCFSNLLNNAIKFVAPETKPQVRVRAERRGEQVRFWVEDNGIGIDAKYFENIFGTFHRLSTAYEGTGIGLTIVRKAMERMGGAAGVVSELGKGSRFWFELTEARNKEEILEPAPRSVR